MKDVESSRRLFEHCNELKLKIDVSLARWIQRSSHVFFVFARDIKKREIMNALQYQPGLNFASTGAVVSKRLKKSNSSMEFTVQLLLLV